MFRIVLALGNPWADLGDIINNLIMTPGGLIIVMLLIAGIVGSLLKHWARWPIVLVCLILAYMFFQMANGHYAMILWTPPWVR